MISFPINTQVCGYSVFMLPGIDGVQKSIRKEKSFVLIASALWGWGKGFLIVRKKLCHLDAISTASSMPQTKLSFWGNY